MVNLFTLIDKFIGNVIVYLSYLGFIHKQNISKGLFSITFLYGVFGSFVCGAVYS